jgi:DnaJ-class molecular chaperone
MRERGVAEPADGPPPPSAALVDDATTGRESDAPPLGAFGSHGMGRILRASRRTVSRSRPSYTARLSMPSRDYYEVLGIGRAASADDIRRAHRKLALEFHPDRNKAKDAPARFAEIQQAYEVLSDADKRSQYDEFVRLGGSPGAFAGGAGAGAGHARAPHGDGAPGQNGGAGNWNSGDWTSSDSATFESIFGDMFGPRGSRARGRAGPGASAGSRARPRERSEAEATIPLEVAIKGGKVGVVLEEDGRQTSVELPVPAGLEDEELLSVPGRLDLVVRARIAPHPWLTREGRDLSYDLPLSIVEATLGAAIDAPLPTGGTVALKIPAGTASGKKIRIAGKGMPAGSGRPAGDLYVVVQIVPPSGVNELTGSLLREIAGSIENPRARLAHLRP